MWTSCRGARVSRVRSRDGIQGPERFDPVCGGDEDNHGNWQGAEVQLVPEILICCQEGVELTSREL